MSEKLVAKEKRCETCEAGTLFEGKRKYCPFQIIEDKMINDDFTEDELESETPILGNIRFDEVEEVIQELSLADLYVITAITGCEACILKKKPEG
jgi:hypothetical protein